MTTTYPLPEVPSLVVGEVIHTRRTPIFHSFRYRSYQWLVDVDRLPRLPFWLRPLASFRAEDHLAGGQSGKGIRGDLEAFLAEQEIDLMPDHRILMLANARALGHVFDPLTVFWALDEDGESLATVSEVHNTYAGRHRYLLEFGETDTAQTEKTFFVSPFNDVSGTYEIRLRLDSSSVSVTVGLDREGSRVLTATTRGVPQPATRTSVVRVSLTHFLMPHRVSALIRLQGIRLWLRRLPLFHPSATAREATK